MADVGIRLLFARNAVTGAIPHLSHIVAVEYKVATAVVNPQFIIGNIIPYRSKPVIII